MDSSFGNVPTKRARVDDGASSSSSDGVPRRSDFWMKDASIILQAENVQFGVHEGVLTMHSEVFKDMFLVGQPGEGAPVADRCPVVELADKADELEMFLRALYGESCVYSYS